MSWSKESEESKRSLTKLWILTNTTDINLNDILINMGVSKLVFKATFIFYQCKMYVALNLS